MNLGSRISDLGSRISDLGSRVSDLGSQIYVFVLFTHNGYYKLHTTFTTLQRTQRVIGTARGDSPLLLFPGTGRLALTAFLRLGATRPYRLSLARAVRPYRLLLTRGDSPSLPSFGSGRLPLAAFHWLGAARTHRLLLARDDSPILPFFGSGRLALTALSTRAMAPSSLCSQRTLEQQFRMLSGLKEHSSNGSSAQWPQ